MTTPTGTNPDPGFAAAVRAVETGDVAALRRLLSDDPDLARATGRDERTLLHYLTDGPARRPNGTETVRILVAAGAPLEARSNQTGRPTGEDTPRETPLHWAVSADDVDVARALLDAGAEVDALGGCIAGGTPLLLAVAFGHRASVELLLARGARVYNLGLAAGMGRLDFVREFFDADGTLLPAAASPAPGRAPAGPLAPDVAGRTIDHAFSWACMAGHADVVRFLLDKGACLDNRALLGKTPLEHATAGNHAAVVELLKHHS